MSSREQDIILEMAQIEEENERTSRELTAEEKLLSQLQDELEEVEARIRVLEIREDSLIEDYAVLKKELMYYREGSTADSDVSSDNQPIYDVSASLVLRDTAHSKEKLEVMSSLEAAFDSEDNTLSEEWEAMMDCDLVGIRFEVNVKVYKLEDTND
jgi:hypothetical protein